MMVSFVLSFFPRDVLDEILNLIESVSEDFPSYSNTLYTGVFFFHCYMLEESMCHLRDVGCQVYVRLAGDHLYGKLLFTWLSLVMSMMVSFCAVLFPTRCLG